MKNVVFSAVISAAVLFGAFELYSVNKDVEVHTVQTSNIQADLDRLAKRVDENSASIKELRDSIMLLADKLDNK